MGHNKEAFELLGEYLEKTDIVQASVNLTIALFVELAAEGFGGDAIEVLRNSASAVILEPLVVGLRLYAGEDVTVATEILEIGKDIVKRIEEKREDIKKGKPRE